MPSTISCPHCDARLKLPDSVTGKTVKCPKCNRAFVASPPGAAAVGDAPPSAPMAVSPNRPEPSAAGPKTKVVSKTGHQHGWFIKTSSGNVGPFTNETIVIAAKEGIIRPDMTLWHDKLQRTVAAGELSGLFPKRHAARQPVQAAQVGGDKTYAVGPDEDDSFAELQNATAPAPVKAAAPVQPSAPPQTRQSSVPSMPRTDSASVQAGVSSSLRERFARLSKKQRWVLVGGGVALLILLGSLFGVIGGSKASSMSYDEFVKAACQEEGGRSCNTTQEELFRRVGKPGSVARLDTSYIYLYYDLQGGQAIVKAVLQHHWENGRAYFTKYDIDYVGE